MTPEEYAADVAAELAARNADIPFDAVLMLEQKTWPPGGPGVPALAASYATSLNLPLVAVPLDHPKHRAAAEEKRTERLVELAEAAVVVWEDADPVRGMLTRLHAKGVRVVVIGATRPSRKPTDAPEDRPRSPGLPG